MTKEQRETLFQIMGRIEGLTWGVEDQQIAEGFCGVAEDLDKLLKEDAKESKSADEFIDRFLKENTNNV